MQYAVPADWTLLPNGSLDETQALATAVMIALGTDALASRDDLLPDPDSTDRAGWWGDLDAELIWDGWPIGSKLWLLQRAKINSPASREGSTLVMVEQYIRNAIQPFVERKICSGFDVWVTRIDTQRIDALVRLYRGPLREVDLKYQVLWSSMAGA